MSLLWAGRSSWRTMAGATQRYATADYATAGSGPTRQSGVRDSESITSQLDAACDLQIHWEPRPELDIDLHQEPSESRYSDSGGKPVG